MGPKVSFDCFSDLGSQDIDQNHDWVNDPRQRYSKLVDIDTFVSRNCRINAKKENIIVDYQTLNGNQKIIFKRIESHYNDVFNGHQIDPLRIIVMGTARIGKTYLIKAIRSRLQEMVGTGSKSPIIVLVPTGVAAFNIDGVTIHSGLSIPIINDSKRLDINKERLKQLQDKLSDQAFSERNNEPFGGRSVILFGDFGQLSPVLDLPMYADNKRDALSNSGLAVYKQLKKVYKFKIIQHQSGNSKEQQELKGIFLRLRNGEPSIEDWIILTTRIEDKLSVIERNEFSNALFLLTKWSEVNAVNIDQLRSLDVPIAKIQAIHTGGNEAKKVDSDTAHRLKACILLARDARVILMANLQTEIGLVNGMMGIVQEIIFSEDQGPPCLPIAGLVSFDNYKRPTITSLEGKKVVPIAPI
ncbi:ATP-dependent DNA helicase Pif1-like [Rhizophagus clarus]|uniref:ATP-dependent DNA helicase n=2 Tax=Rhizophagus clarus TaxID=94130 RepID=A0A8H3KZC0_9GLOM|nr:ATP-dependent DNA helicase Pif1-like [Rhizophagus clarus]